MRVILRARRLPSLISNDVWNQMVIYLEQAFERGQGTKESREKAEGWAVIQSLSLILQALKAQTQLLKSKVWLYFLGVLIEGAKFCLLKRRDLTEELFLDVCLSFTCCKGGIEPSKLKCLMYKEALSHIWITTLSHSIYGRLKYSNVSGTGHSL